MGTDLEGEELTCFEMAPDGSSFRIHLEDTSGQPASLSLPTRCLNRLM